MEASISLRTCDAASDPKMVIYYHQLSTPLHYIEVNHVYQDSY